MNKILMSLCLFALLHFGSAETGCPYAEDILPCICTGSSVTILTCDKVNDAEDLRKVFRNSERYRYTEVHIQYSSLQFLPHDVFSTVTVKGLYLKNVTLTQLFDTLPSDLEELRTLHIENTKLIRGVLWRLLEPLKGLRTLNIYYNVIKSLGNEFSQYVSNDIEQISFYGTETKSLMTGVFSNFTKLDRIEISGTKLKTLKRDMFPVPFIGKYLYFNYNNISTLSNDLFTQMPNLKSLGLRNNQISTLPESAFDGNFMNIRNLWLDGNPLSCDCLLQWITRNNLEDLRGQCVKPKTMEGKDIKDLSPRDFSC